MLEFGFSVRDGSDDCVVCQVFVIFGLGFFVINVTQIGYLLFVSAHV